MRKVLCHREVLTACTGTSTMHSVREVVRRYEEKSRGPHSTYLELDRAVPMPGFDPRTSVLGLDWIEEHLGRVRVRIGVRRRGLWRRGFVEEGGEGGL